MEIKEILNKAFSFGQTYWQQADSEYASQHKKADLTLDRFNEFSLSIEIDIANAKFKMNETEKQRNDLLAAFNAAKSKIECSQRSHERASAILVDEALEIIDAAIASARGE